VFQIYPTLLLLPCLGITNFLFFFQEPEKSSSEFFQSFLIFFFYFSQWDNKKLLNLTFWSSSIALGEKFFIKFELFWTHRIQNMKFLRAKRLAIILFFFPQKSHPPSGSGQATHSLHAPHTNRANVITTSARDIISPLLLEEEWESLEEEEQGKYLVDGVVVDEGLHNVTFANPKEL
jgi:hypothetical protein